MSRARVASFAPAAFAASLAAAFAVSFVAAAWFAAGDRAPDLDEVASQLGLSDPAASLSDAPAIGREATAAEPWVDPFTLAASIIEARQRFTDSGDDIALLAARAAHLGREVEWEVRYVEPFCTAPDRCAVLPFDHARLEERYLQGWMPRLALSAAEHRLLSETCASHPRCVVTLRAEISELMLTPGLPTSITLSAVRIRSARGERDDESWIRRRSPSRTRATFLDASPGASATPPA